MLSPYPWGDSTRWYFLRPAASDLNVLGLPYDPLSKVISALLGVSTKMGDGHVNDQHAQDAV